MAAPRGVCCGGGAAAPVPDWELQGAAARLLCATKAPQTLHTCLFPNWELVKASCWGEGRSSVILLLFLSSCGGRFLQAAAEEMCQS